MTARIQAPPARLVNVFNGKKAPDKFIAALSEADNLCAELDGLRESQTRVQELEAELAELKADRDGFRESALDLSTVLQSAFADIAAVTQERDDYRTAANAEAEGLDRFKAERDLARADADDAAETIGLLLAERDDLAERLDSLSNAHQITLAALADARRGLTEPWHGVASGGQS